MARHWTAFGAAGKGVCSVSDLLKCKSGVEAVLPAKFSTYTSFTKDNFPNVCKEIAAAEPIYLRTCRHPPPFSHAHGLLDNVTRWMWSVWCAVVWC